MAPAAPKQKFTENEKVLCYHGPLLYEAKCVKVKKDGNSFLYFVHYQGWNKNWDEWVNETRILKINDENREKKEKLMANLTATKEKKKSKSSKKSKSGTDSANTSRASTPVSDRSFKGAHPGSAPNRSLEDDLQSTSSREDDREREPKSRKRPRNSTSNSIALDDSVDEESRGLTPSTEEPNLEFLAEREVFKIPIPEELRYVLVSDWELITQKKSLFNLPAKQTVNSIFNEYKKHVDKTGEIENLSAVSEVMAGVKDYFDETAGCLLLYKIEKPQYDTIMKQNENKNPSDIYGSAHLLRLMVKMKSLLNQSNIKEETDVQMIENILANFLFYLESNRSRLFTSKNYTEASEDYLKLVDP